MTEAMEHSTGMMWGRGTFGSLIAVVPVVAGIALAKCILFRAP